MIRSPLKLLVTLIGALSILVGAVVLMGWHTHNIKLIQINEAFAPMQYNTALGFLLSGVALLLLVAGREWEAGVFGLAVLLIGGLTLIEYIGGVDLYLDQLFMKHYVSVKTSHPGRMAPNTAFCFSLIGFAALFSAIRTGKNLVPAVIGVLGALIFGLGVVAFTGYFLGLETAYGWGGLTRMAVHTAVGVSTVGIGFMVLAWDKERTITLELPSWLPIHVGMAGCAITVALWQAIHAQEYHLIRSLGPESGNIADEAVLIFGVILFVALAFSSYQKQVALRQMERASWANELYQRELTERKRVETELRIAQTIQMSFLPRKFPPFPMRQEIDLHAALIPAREVGGDFYDYFMLGKDQLFISVGDVSDKGIPSALFMAVTKSLMKGIAVPGMKPTELLEQGERRTLPGKRRFDVSHSFLRYS